MIAILMSLVLDYGDAYREWQTGKPMVVMVSAGWCPACPDVERKILSVKGRYSFVKLDHDRDSMSPEFKVQSLPTTFIYVPGRPLVRFTGYDDQRLRSALKGFLEHEKN